MSKYLNKDGISYLTYRYSYVFAPKSHIHDISLASSTGTSSITLSYGSKYQLTAGGKSVIFTMPTDNNTDTYIKTVSVTGTGNAVTTSYLSTDYKTLTLYKGSSFNYYTHPNYTAHSSGLYKVTVDSTGHVSAVTSVTSTDISSLGVKITDTNTTNTAGANNTYGKKLFLIGTETQGAAPTTVSSSYCYVGTDNCLYSNGAKVLTSDSDTKNTAGSTNSTSKLYLIGATSQASNPVTNSNSSVFATNGVLTSTSFTSTTTSSAPLTVNSTTLVSKLNADKVDGYDVATAGTTKPWSMLVSIGSDGVSEMGRYIDFHYDNTTGSDYSLRMQVPGNNSNTITLPTATGTLALTSQLSDTKNTAGSNNSTSKLYLIGATSQAANPVTNSNSLCYTQNSYLYSYGNKVIAENDALTTTEVESICKEILGV